MKRIGILTFHWATNYGAVLQAYALQKFLEKHGFEAFIIDYKPSKYKFSLKRIFKAILKFEFLTLFKEIKKEKQLKLFRQQYLNLTVKYNSEKSLKENPPDFDIYIVGSDQIFNPSFTLFGENGKPSLVYYLNFVTKNAKKIGYAVSFGCVRYPEQAKKLIQSYIHNFDYISVRENSGIDILSGMGYKKTTIVPDPTLLLYRNEFETLIPIYKKTMNDYVFIYMLRVSDTTIKMLIDLYPNCKLADDSKDLSLSMWLYKIKNSKAVITNSYHGMIFCLHFHIPFVILLGKNEIIGMNDRFFTLLEIIGLQNRIIKYNDIQQIDKVLIAPINWNEIEGKIENYRNIGIEFLQTNL